MTWWWKPTPFLSASSTPAIAIAVILLAGACNDDDDARAPSPAEKASDPDPLALSLPADKNPDPNVLEIDLEAREATKIYDADESGGTHPPTSVWTFGGTIPGPLLDAKVGDRLIVHFKNSLPEPTTIHWHGIRLPATMDGSLAMQQPIPPGGTFRYEFTLKDAGLFWYHPHIRSDIQVQKGLYGVIRVRGDAAAAAAAEPANVDDERILVLDDVRLKPDGTLSEYLDDTSKMMGRTGNTLLVNGVSSAKAMIPVHAGALTRFRIVNVANGRFFNLRIPGHVWRIVGTDGGLLPKPYDAERLLVSPGERYDVMLIPLIPPANAPESAQQPILLPLLNDPYERGHESGLEQTMTVASLRFVQAAAPLTGRALPERFAPIDPFPRPSSPSQTTIPIDLDEATRNGELVFTINGAVFPDVPKVMVERGGSRVLEVKNTSEMDHPFHLHGFFFQVLEKNGAPALLDTTGNKDTIIIPAKSTLKLLSRFDEPGMWMYHCHILEHAEGGMMGEIHVE